MARDSAIERRMMKISYHGITLLSMLNITQDLLTSIFSAAYPTEKLSPHPQVPLTLGLLNLKASLMPSRR